jgi:hypothetical protein
MLSWYARHPKLVDGVHRTTNSGCSGRPPGPQFPLIGRNDRLAVVGVVPGKVVGHGPASIAGGACPTSVVLGHFVIRPTP